MNSSKARRKAGRVGMALAMLAGTLSVGSVSAAIAEHVTHAAVGGMQVYTYRMGVPEEIVIRGALPAGDVFSASDKPAIATLVAGMLDKGTRRHDKFALAQELDDVGARIAFNAGEEVVTFQIRCLKQNLALVLSLLAEELRTPAFSAAELDKYKTELTGQLRRASDNTGARADEAFHRATFPVGHPNHPASTAELLKSVEQASIEDLRAFHLAHYGPDHLTLVAVGDVDGSALQRELRRAFAGWHGGSDLPHAPAATSATAPAQPVLVVSMPGKTSVNVLWGQATGLRYRDADALPLRVATEILGSGFTGRLMATVRDKDGLTYGIGARLRDDTFSDGAFAISATFAPNLLDKGLAATQEQLGLWWQNGVTAQELATRKIGMIGGFQVSLASPAGVATAILDTVQRGYPVSWLDEYPKAIGAVTLGEVNAAIKRHLDPQKMIVVKAGSIASS